MRVGRLNVDENPVTAARFRIRSIPALPMFKGDSEVDRIVGAQPKSEVRFVDHTESLGTVKR